MIVSNRAQTIILEQKSGVPASELMERAGRGCFDFLQSLVEPNSRVLVCCGKGNNGGDGLVLARLAKEQGWDVTCLLFSPEGGLRELCSEKFGEAQTEGVRCDWIESVTDFGSYLNQFDVVVDAIYGSGFSGGLDEPTRTLIEKLNTSGKTVLSLDIPSGIECDTGKISGVAVRADHVAVIGSLKPYLFQNDGLSAAGDWELVDIGLNTKLDSFGQVATYVTQENVSLEPRAKDSNKGRNGHVLVIAGSDEYRGAAVLATLGALQAGAGLVTVAAIEPVISAVAAQVPEAILLPLLADGGTISADAYQKIQGQAHKYSSAVIGPGLTQNPSVASFLSQLWKQWNVPTILDADALNLVANGLELPQSLALMTPHPGEAARLLSCSVPDVQSDRFGAVQSLSREFGCAVILKGAYSLACENREVFVNSFGNAGMATGGMGDVLAGVAGALAGQPLFGMKSMALHGLAGDLAQQEIGEFGYSATQVAHFLPRARSILTKQKEREHLNT